MCSFLNRVTQFAIMVTVSAYHFFDYFKLFFKGVTMYFGHLQHLTQYLVDKQNFFRNFFVILLRLYAYSNEQ